MLSWGDEALVRRDPELAGLGVLLDAEALAAQLAAARTDLGLRAVRADYLRYKPGTRCLAGLVLETDALGSVRGHAVVHGRDAEVKLRKTEEAARRTGATASLALLPELGLSLSLFPFDRKLRVLRRLMDPEAAAERLAPVLGEAHRPSSLEALAYKPERRYVAAARAHGKPVAALKLFARGDDMAAAARIRIAGETARDGERLNVPRLLAHLPRWRLLVLAWLDGLPLREALSSAAALPALERVGAALAELHGRPTAGLPAPGPRAGARAVFAAAEHVGWLLPSAGRRVRRLAERVAADLDGAACDAFVHGDFYDKQVLLQDERVGVLDFDASHRGDAAEDLGLLLAHLEVARLAGERVTPDAASAERALVEGYAQHREPPSAARLRLQRAAGLLCLAPHPFRARRATWWDEVEAVVAAATGALSPDAPRRAPVALVDPWGLAGDTAFVGVDRLLDPDAMAKRFRAMFPASGFERVDSIRVRRHKRGRRVVIEYGLRMVAGLRLAVLAKVRAKGVDHKGHRRAERLAGALSRLESSHLRLPQPVGIAADLRATFQRVEPGRPVTRELGRSLRLGTATGQRLLGERVARAIRELQSLECPDLREHTVADELGILERQLAELGSAAGKWAAPARRVLEGARRAAARLEGAPLVTAHRDLHPDQILDGGERLTFVDLDLVARADPALDPANLAAHATELALRCGQPADALAPFEEALARGNERPGDVRIWAAWALARLAAISIRMPERRHATGRLIDEAERRLS